MPIPNPQRDPNEVVVLVRQNGPFRVYGPARLVDHEGNEFEIPEGEWFSLCRCGHSARKPFCDSTHKTIDFDGKSVTPLKG